MLIDFIILFLVISILITLYIIAHANKEKVFLKEKSIIVHEPFFIEGKPDLVTIEKNNLRVYDLKTRQYSKVFYSDIVQLSTYKILLERKYKKKVIEGFIIITNENFSKKIKINFLEEEQIILLYKRLTIINQNPALAKYCNNKNICKSCAFYLKNCFPT